MKTALGCCKHGSFKFKLAIACWAAMLAVQRTPASTLEAEAIGVSTVRGLTRGITISSNAYLSAGNSLTLQGAGGFITAASSITASAFFGDGSNLSGVLALNSTNTFSGSNTFASSFTVRSEGRQIILSTSTTTTTISMSGSGALTFSPELHNSSRTTIPEYSTNNTTFGPCITGSTLTITTSGGRVELIFVGTLARDNPFSSAGFGVNFLQDGSFVRNLSSTLGIGQLSSLALISVERTTPFSYLLDAPTPGSHSYCVTINSVSSSNTTVLRNNASIGNLFYALEIK